MKKKKSNWSVKKETCLWQECIKETEMATNPIKSSCKWWKLCEFRLIHLPKCKASWSYKLKVSKKANEGKHLKMLLVKWTLSFALELVTISELSANKEKYFKISTICMNWIVINRCL